MQSRSASQNALASDVDRSEGITPISRRRPRSRDDQYLDWYFVDRDDPDYHDGWEPIRRRKNRGHGHGHA
jgi:hypothetical protein